MKDILSASGRNPLPELLAPAGNLEAALTAYKYGADAVYAGLDKFNAREMGQNFSFEDMSRLSAYAKDKGKHFYLTLNTLIKEQELAELFLLLDKTAQLEPDGIIIQDLGVLNILKTYYPQLKIHGSTQMGFHNSAGLQTAGRLGLTRVILERQVSLAEIKTMLPDSPVEVEIFIHGALCCGLSGHCLFSSWIGGWSGNRGKCKQPCRRRYHSGTSGDKQSGFFFSPQDLYTLDLMGELKTLGLSSLKIEGRLKQPDYIRQVVRAYRMVLDAPPGQESDVLKEARAILSSSYGRRWSHGFYLPEESAGLLQYDSAGVSGQLLGNVAGTKDKGFELLLSRRLHLGDRLRVQSRSGEEGPALTVTRMTLGAKTTETARRGDKVFIHCDKDIPADGLVYKIGESRKEDLPDRAALPEYRPPVKVDIEIYLDKQGMRARVPAAADKNQQALELFWEGPLQEAENRPLEQAQLAELFSATRDPRYALGGLKLFSAGGWFIPPGELKKRRRQFWDRLSGEIQIEPAEATVFHYPGVSERRSQKAPLLSVFFSSAGDFEANAKKLKKEFPGSPLVGVESLESWDESAESELLLPHFCPENELPALEKKIKKAVQAGVSRFRITSLYQLETLRSYSGLTLTAAFPLPAANSFAAQELKTAGLNRAQAWLELEKESLLLFLEHSPLPLELYHRGRPFLLATRGPVKIQGEFTDARKGSFFLKKRNPGGALDYVYSREILDLPLIEGMDLFFESGLPETSPVKTFNFSGTWA